MKIHKNARLTPKGREILVRRIVNGGLRVEEAAQASGVSARTAYKWLARYRAQGRAGLRDRIFASARLPASHLRDATGGDSGPAPRPVHLSRD